MPHGAMHPLAEKEQWVSAFEAFEKSQSDQGPSWISPIRREALSRFVALNFPTPRDEEWKYTNVTPIVTAPLRLLDEPDLNGLTRQEIKAFTFDAAGGATFVFVNGFYSKALSSVSASWEGVKVGSLARALRDDSGVMEAHLARTVRYDRNPFTAMNTAFIRDGAFVYLPKNCSLDMPIHLLFIGFSSRGENPLAQPRNLIVAEAGSCGTLIESYVSLGTDTHFTNTVTEVILKEGATLEHYKIQRESERAFHVATTQVEQGPASTFSSASISSGAALARNNLNVILNKEGATCALDGLYLAAGRQHVDNTTVIDHAKPRGTSRQLYKGILDGKSTAVFSGKIFVRKDAQKTDAEQINKNLLLSKDATADTKPQLEIFADDVKCTHGAAVGQLDEAQMFYLRSRGMGHETARNLLTHGFASEIINRIKLGPVRSELESLLWKWFGKVGLTEGES